MYQAVYRAFSEWVVQTAKLDQFSTPPNNSSALGANAPVAARKRLAPCHLVEVASPLEAAGCSGGNKAGPPNIGPPVGNKRQKTPAPKAKASMPALPAKAQAAQKALQSIVASVGRFKNKAADLGVGGAEGKAAETSGQACLKNLQKFTQAFATSMQQP